MDRNDYYGGDSTSLNLNQARSYGSIILFLFETVTCIQLVRLVND
jgi:RAB protein geranylgeranyltransferase component A